MEVGAAQIAEGADLFGELLHPVFAEETMPCVVGLHDALRRMGLGDRHQGDLFGIAPSAPGGAGEALVDGGEICSDAHWASPHFSRWTEACSSSFGSAPG